MGRMERVNQLIKKEIGKIIQREMQDPRLQFVSITAVDVSPDLHNARVSFSVLGDEKRIEEVTQVLQHASGYLRKMVGNKITLRYTPAIEFIYDQSIVYSAQIEQTLEEINNESRSSTPNEE